MAIDIQRMRINKFDGGETEHGLLIIFSDFGGKGIVLLYSIEESVKFL